MSSFVTWWGLLASYSALVALNVAVLFVDRWRKRRHLQLFPLQPPTWPPAPPRVSIGDVLALMSGKCTDPNCTRCRPHRN